MSPGLLSTDRIRSSRLLRHMMLLYNIRCIAIESVLINITQYLLCNYEVYVKLTVKLQLSYYYYVHAYRVKYIA